MRTIVLAGLFAVSSLLVTVQAAPAKAGGLNCWYQYIYGDDIDIDGDGATDANSGVLLEVIEHCQVQQEEVEP